MAARKRRETTTADQIKEGDLINPDDNIYRATVYRVSTSRMHDQPNVVLYWQYPADFSANSSTRGSSESRVYRPSDPIDRWVAAR
jgi:hypothetical protein